MFREGRLSGGRRSERAHGGAPGQGQTPPKGIITFEAQLLSSQTLMVLI